MVRKMISQLLTQVSHILEVTRMFLPKPFPHLLCPELFISYRFKILGKFLLRKISNIVLSGHFAKISCLLQRRKCMSVLLPKAGMGYVLKTSILHFFNKMKEYNEECICCGCVANCNWQIRRSPERYSS